MMKKENIAYETIFELVRLVPKGRVTSYGAIAECIGMKGAARMVGYAMNHSHKITPKVPAHRVVNRNGMLTGRHHFSTETEMQELLEKEGIQIKDNKIINFESVFWNPNEIIKKL